MVNYSTPDRTLRMPCPRVKTPAPVLWVSLTGAACDVFGLSVYYTSGWGIPGYRRLQVCHDLSYFLSCLRNFTVFIWLNCFIRKQSRNQREWKMTCNPALHMGYKNLMCSMSVHYIIQKH
jgi:hypothetical protein